MKTVMKAQTAKVEIGQVFRDTGFVYFANYLGGFAVGYALGMLEQPEYLIPAVYAEGYLLTLICYWFVLKWTEQHKAAHLFAVATLLGLVSILEVISAHGDIIHFILNMLAVYVLAGVAWGLHWKFGRNSKTGG